MPLVDVGLHQLRRDQGRIGPERQRLLKLLLGGNGVTEPLLDIGKLKVGVGILRAIANRIAQLDNCPTHVAFLQRLLSEPEMILAANENVSTPRRRPRAGRWR